MMSGTHPLFKLPEQPYWHTTVRNRIDVYDKKEKKKVFHIDKDKTDLPAWLAVGIEWYKRHPFDKQWNEDIIFPLVDRTLERMDQRLGRLYTEYMLAKNEICREYASHVSWRKKQKKIMREINNVKQD